MKPSSFNYIRAESVDHVLDCLATHGEAARILAGGQSLIAMMNFRLVEPGYLIDISSLDVTWAKNVELSIAECVETQKERKK